jgi:hypothetical protein
MPCVIGFIADEMLPKPPLPDAALAARALRPARGRSRFGSAPANRLLISRQCVGTSPSPRWQGPDVLMIEGSLTKYGGDQGHNDAMDQRVNALDWPEFAISTKVKVIRA